MIYVQMSAGQGPKECMRAVYLAQKQFLREAQQQKIDCSVLSMEAGDGGGTLRSILFALEAGQNRTHLKSWLSTWEGSLQWICASPYRARHPRKNWFIGVQVFQSSQPTIDSTIRYEVCKSGGPGGQHVNTTNSAVVAIHPQTGIRVRVETERSQHANKKLATQLLQWRLLQQAEQVVQEQKAEQRLAHFQVERGNPQRIYEGDAFVLRSK